jgi:dTDP-4-amino-4,6-dideoxy-D-galactose acyltransferase
MIQKLCWDTEFFGVGTGSIFLSDAVKAGWDEVKARMDRYGLGLLYVFHDITGGDPTQGDEHRESFLSASGARLMDRKVIFEKDLTENTVNSEPDALIYEASDPDEALYSLALQSGAYSRFRLDERFPQGSFEKMYRIWMEKSTRGDMADCVLVVKHQEKTAGMVTVKYSGRESSIGLIAVDESARGLNLGQKLIRGAEYEAFGAGSRLMTVATQLDNEPACRFYSKMGYRIQSVILIWHVWRGKSGESVELTKN